MVVRDARRPRSAWPTTYAGKFEIYWAVGNDEIDYLLLNLKDPVLGRNKPLRQALAAAFDAQAVIDVLYNGRAPPLESLVPYDVPGNERETGAVAQPRTTSPRRAEAAGQAGYPRRQGPAAADDQLLRDQRRDAQRVRPAARRSSRRSASRSRPSSWTSPRSPRPAENGNFQLASYGWVADYPDPENFYQLFYSRNAAAGHQLGSYANPAYDKAYEAMRLMPNGPERLGYIRTMNALPRRTTCP